MKRADDEQPAGPTLKDYDVLETLCFSTAWHPHRPWEPPGANEWRWSSWRQYLQEWKAIRAEWVAAKGEHRRDGDPWYADRVASFAQRYGLKALESASPYRIRGEPEPQVGETYEDDQRRVADDVDDPDPET